jgi:hypothetical protein
MWDLFGSKYTKKVEAELADSKRKNEESVNAVQEAWTLYRQTVNERIADKDGLIEILTVRLAASEAECERMRMVMLPLSSQAGAAYARSQSVARQQTTSKTLIEGRVPSTDWPTYLKESVAQMEAEIAADEKKKSEAKEN